MFFSRSFSQVCLTLLRKLGMRVLKIVRDLLTIRQVFINEVKP